MEILEPYYAGIPAELLPDLQRFPIRVVLDNLRSAYNVGSIFRTSDAGAIEHIHLCGLTAHPPNPKLEKTALGAFEYVPWTYHEQTAGTLAALRDEGLAVIGVENAPGAEVYCAFAWPRPVVLVVGNEVEGVAPEVLSLCDHRVAIPVLGYKRTLNVATAFGIVLFEVLRQWGALLSE
ncbi:MAG: TrmH family RNA methyltransferase [Armatimonadetes bacterium]|nr:TrmH family RNA methyltransferase [Armatimonadota bacterium]